MFDFGMKRLDLFTENVGVWIENVGFCRCWHKIYAGDFISEYVGEILTLGE